MPKRQKKTTASKMAAAEKTTVVQQAGHVSEELEVPVASDVVFRKVWHIRHFSDTTHRKDSIDSPAFRCAVNGMVTLWNMSIRFWRGQSGRKVSNPIVVCLNLTGCESEGMGQARIRFQFGVWDYSIRQWECCSISSVVLHLDAIKGTHELISIGYKSLSILDRHLNAGKDVHVMVKLQIIHSDEEVRSLSQDMGRLLSGKCEQDLGSDESTAAAVYTKDTLIDCATLYSDDDHPDDKQDAPLVHSWVVRMRSHRMWRSLRRQDNPMTTDDKSIRFRLNLSEVHVHVVNELVRYLYTDKVDNADQYAAKLLPLAVRYHLTGLRRICERALLSGVTPSNVASVLLVSDRCGCDNLRKALLQYCEHSDAIRESVQQPEKTLAWRVMEMVNPDLFLEACQTFGSSSSSSTHSKSGGGGNGSDVTMPLGSWCD